MANNPKYMLDDYDGLNPAWMTESDLGHTFIENAAYGSVEVGRVPGKKYDQPLLHVAKAGAVVAGFIYVRTTLKVLMIDGNRFNLIGGQDWELPGGFSENGETKVANASRETLEETGINLAGRPMIQLHTRLYTGDRAFNVLKNEDDGNGAYGFALYNEEVPMIEASDHLALMSWTDAIRISRDGLSKSGVGLLKAWIDEAGAKSS